MHVKKWPFWGRGISVRKREAHESGRETPTGNNSPERSPCWKELESSSDTLFINLANPLLSMYSDNLLIPGQISLTPDVACHYCLGLCRIFHVATVCSAPSHWPTGVAPTFNHKCMSPTYNQFQLNILSVLILIFLNLIRKVSNFSTKNYFISWLWG